MKAFVCLLLLSICFYSYSQELTLQEKIANLKQENQRLQEMQSRLGDATTSFEEVKKNTDHVLEQSSQNLRENMIRVMAGGLKDMFESTVETSTSWIGGVTIVAMKVVSYYRDQWMGNKVQSEYHNQQVNMEAIARNMQMLADNNNDVYKKVSVLDYCVRLPLEYFDDDNRELIQLFPEIEQYWKEADGLVDDDTEKSTRKLNILRNTSKKASDKLGEEITKMKDDIQKIKNQIEANNKRINELDRQTSDWNANREQPDRIDYSNEIEDPEPEVNTGTVSWDDCLNMRTREHAGDYGGQIESYEHWSKRMKEYHKKGYRFLTRLSGFEFPDTIVYKVSIDYTCQLKNPELHAPARPYLYEIKVFINGIEANPRDTKSYSLGENKLVFKLMSCDKLIDQIETTTIFIHPIDEVEVYWKDPISEVKQNWDVSFVPKIHHPTIRHPEARFNYYFKYIFDDVEQDSQNTYRFTPHRSLLTPGKHEVTVQLYDGFTDELVDQYLHHLTVLEPDGGAGNQIATAEKPDLRNMEGKRILALDLGWAKYEYVFKSNQVKIEGFYLWNNQKVNYVSEPLKEYVPGITGVPGMVMTKTSAYHIYQTIDEGNDACGNYIVCQMKGADIKILHRVYACVFNVIPAPDGSKITVKYNEIPNTALKEIVLY